MKLRFHLRDLFWLVLVAAMACAWWWDRGHAASAARQNDEAWIKAIEGWVSPSDARMIHAQFLSIKGAGPPLIPRNTPRGITGVHVLPRGDDDSTARQ
jgi:hypothetical protein